MSSIIRISLHPSLTLAYLITVPKCVPLEIAHVDTTGVEGIDGYVTTITCDVGYEAAAANQTAACMRVNATDPYELTWIHPYNPCISRLHSANSSMKNEPKNRHVLFKY